MPPVPTYHQFKKDLRRRAAQIGYQGRGSRWARRTPDTWEVIALHVPPQAQVEPRAVRFHISVEVTLHIVHRYWNRTAQPEDPGPPRDGQHSISCGINPPAFPAATMWTARESDDPFVLAERVWTEFERIGVPFLQQHANAPAIRDLLLPLLDEPPTSHHSIATLALLCKALGPIEAYTRAMDLLEHFPGPPTYRSFARDHWHMIQRFEV